MNKINLLLFIFLLPCCVLGANLEKNYHFSNISLKLKSQKPLTSHYISETITTIKKASKLEEIKKISSLDIIINNTFYSNKISYSNVDRNMCKITLNYDYSGKGSLLENYHDDLLFTYFHEVSHCLLGKSIFDYDINWQNLTPDQTSFINAKILKLMNEATVNIQCTKDCLAVNMFKTSPPLLVYHEIYADLMAFYLFSLYDCHHASQIFSEIENIRSTNYWANPKPNLHQSFRAFNYIEKRNFCIDPPKLEDIKMLTQKGFLEYLNTID